MPQGGLCTLRQGQGWRDQHRGARQGKIYFIVCVKIFRASKNIWSLCHVVGGLLFVPDIVLAVGTVSPGPHRCPAPNTLI